MSPALYSPTKPRPFGKSSKKRQFSREGSWVMSDDDLVGSDAGSAMFSPTPSTAMIPFAEDSIYEGSTILEGDEFDDEEDAIIDDEQLGPEVDGFARHLDLYRRTRGDEGDENSVEQLVLGFHADTIDHYEESRQREIAYLGDDEHHMIEIIEETKFYKMEAETWDLIRRIFPGRKSEFGAVGSARRVANYESNELLRRQLYKESSIFRELNIIRDWLRSIAPDPADGEAEDDETMVSGHMYTLEALKNFKRQHVDEAEWQRNGPSSRFEYPGRGIPDPEAQATYITTEVDPDAPSRQGRNVASGDHYYDTSFYRALWGFIRRGDFKGGAEWCRKCNQSWRAPVVLGGRDAIDWVVDEEIADDPTEELSQDDGPMGNRRRQLWRRACYSAATRASAAPGDVFEKATYGLLAGDIDTALPGCQDWHDHIYARVNALVETHYDHYLQRHDRIPEDVFTLPMSDAVTQLGSTNVVAKIVDDLARPDDHRFAEANSQILALRAIQGAVISDRVPHLVGVVANQLRQFKIDPGYEPAKDTNTPVDCTDWKFLRVVTHVIIVLQQLGQWPTVGKVAVDGQDVIAGYIRMLAAAQKYKVMPLYASKLSHERCVDVMGEVLLHVAHDHTRQDLIESFKLYGLDTKATLKRAMENAFIQTKALYEQDKIPISAISEFSFSKESRKPIQGEDENLIRTAEWMLLVDDMHEDILEAGVLMYKRFYLTGRLMAAKALRQRIYSKDISLEEAEISEAGQTVASVYVEYEFLIDGLDALDEWNSLLAKAIANKRDGLTRRGKLKDELQVAYERVEGCLQRLVEAWLPGWEDRDDRDQVSYIRNTYIPDITMALHQVHLAAGTNLAKAYLSKCLDLAVLVAKQDSGVADTFIQTGRMAKYVDELANVSVFCLAASKGVTKQPDVLRSGSTEGTTAIWNVKPLVPEPQVAE